MSSNFRSLTSRQLEFKDVPTMPEWHHATFVDLGQSTSRRLGLRSGNRMTPSIDVGHIGDEGFALVTKVLNDFQAARDEYDPLTPSTRYPYLRCLLNVYATSSRWMRNAIANLNVVSAQRIPAARALSWIAADKLAHLLGCHPDALEPTLMKLFTIQLTDHGRHCDGIDQTGQRKKEPWELDNLVYLSDAEVAQYRIYFQDGKAYQHPVYNDSLPITSLALCDTTAFKDHPAYQGRMQSNPEGVFGFAMTFNRLLYAAVHECERRTSSNPTATRFYHSSYIEGQPVLCTGCIGIKNGVINYLNNFSGHYQPPPVQLVHVLEAFRTYGVNLNNIKVDAQSAAGVISGVSAPRFIDQRGRTPLRYFIRAALKRYDDKIKWRQSSESRDAVNVLGQLVSKGEPGEDNLQVGVRFYLGQSMTPPTGVVATTQLKRDSSLYKYLQEEYNKWQNDMKWTPNLQKESTASLSSF